MGRGRFSLVLTLVVAPAIGCRTPGLPLSAPAPTPLTIAAAGDLYLGGRFTSNPLIDSRALLDGDVRFLNLEGPITDRGAETGFDAEGAPQGGSVRLKVPWARVDWLAGRVDVVSIENNHIEDQGAAGHEDTIASLKEHGIAAVDRSHPITLQRNGTTVTFLARQYSPNANLDGESEIVEAVRAARTAGPVVVSLHWGHTGMRIPDAGQKRLARRIIDAGASAILGHGPHSLQGIEMYKTGVIAYSMGNLAFGCQCTKEDDAFVLRFALSQDGQVSRVEALPIAAGLLEAPRRSNDEGLYDLIETLSRDLGITLSAHPGRLGLIRRRRPPARSASPRR